MVLKNSKLMTTPIAHRGLHGEEVPENSLLAFEKAIELGFPIEFDVRIIDDGNIVVFHDDRLGRLTDRDGYVASLTTSDLSEMRLSGSDQTIPTLEQVLELVNGRVPLLIEIKTNTRKAYAVEAKTADILKSYSGDYAIQAFSPYSLEYFKLHSPDVPRGQLSSFLTKGSGLSYFARLKLSHLKVLSISSPHFISYALSDLPNKYVSKTNLPIISWTARSQSEFDLSKALSNNVIFENFIPETK